MIRDGKQFPQVSITRMAVCVAAVGALCFLTALARKPEDKEEMMKIVAVGDSLMDGGQCDGDPDRTSVPAQLQTMLRTSGLKVEVYNAGVGSMGVQYAVDMPGNGYSGSSEYCHHDNNP